MRLDIITKQQLTERQALHLNERLAAPEHANDSGPCRVWSTYQFALYAFIHKETGLPIAIAEASGRPVAVPGWWIDSKFRGMGYGNELVDLLAAKLKSEGVTGIGRILIDTYNGHYNAQSSRLAKRIRAHFESRDC
ncbi:MAG: GNAT family N-acetyltransferase [Burkholderiales bacterium]